MKFKMYALVNRKEEGYYYNIKIQNLTDELTCECLLPSEKLAQQIIDDKLSPDYLIITVDIHDFNEDKILAYSTNKHQVLENEYMSLPYKNSH